MPCLRADMRLTLATVLKAAGRHDQARLAARVATDLYRHMGNQVAASRARELVT